MLRKIKFRGLSINGKWHYGLIAECFKKRGVIEVGMYISNSVGMPFAYQVRPETIGQFTGMIDKNGKEIYEDDILKFPDGTIHEVYYHSFRPCFSLYTSDSNNDKNDEWDVFIDASFEIIGNIYENTSLVKF